MTNSDTELSDFTKLVLARLETNPDEFQLGGRWDTLVRGLEARAFGDTEGKYARILWALSEHERDVVFEAYRKAYLARLHKDMLKNIVSGDDLPKTLDPIKGTLRGASPSTVLTASAMQQATLSTLQDSFNDAFSNAIVKGEGQAVVPDSNTAYTYKSANRYVLNRTQMELAKKLNMSEKEFAEYAHLVNTHINTGGPV